MVFGVNMSKWGWGLIATLIFGAAARLIWINDIEYKTDETYTFAQDSFSRKRVHVLTSVNYKKMSAEDKAKEPAATRRTDGDYALSYIQHVGNGRVFYEAHGHDEKIYFQRPFVAHMLAGIQYALGDLKADDSPSEK